jgi:hypothetical protein
MGKWPTGREQLESKQFIGAQLVAGLLFGLAAITVYSGYTISELRVLGRLQAEVIE